MDHERVGFQARLEGGVAYSMQTYPTQPTIFVQQNVPYPFPTSNEYNQQPQQHTQMPYTNTNQSGGGLYNNNNQYYTTNNI